MARKLISSLLFSEGNTVLKGLKSKLLPSHGGGISLEALSLLLEN